ncbi:MAG: MCE family protein [Verrucomicrobiales bacterium]|nr:MCE family protein [Verrucomicrobiales bacterium]
MAIRKQRTELYVGLFVFFGLAVMGLLIFQFGRFNDRVRGHYSMTVEFPDVGSLRPGVPITLGGRKIGFAKEGPFMKEDFSGLTMELAIYKDALIPKGSTFQVGTSGLMGDTFVEIKMPEKFDGTFYGEGDYIEGSTGSGLDDLQSDAGVLIAKITEAAEGLTRSLEKIENGVLQTENLENLKVTIVELRASSENIKSATEKLDPIVKDVQATVAEAKTAMEKAGTTFDTATETLESVKGTVAKAEPALEKLEPAVDELKAALENANAAITEIRNGDGTAAALINDSNLRQDLVSFADKLEKYGILGYPKDKSKPESSESPSQRSRSNALPRKYR